MSIEERARPLRTLLRQLEDADPEHEVFGSDAHRYRLVAPCTEDDVTRIETDLTISLPAAYRAFLKEIGNGGAGPGYGLERLAITRPPRRSPPRDARVTLDDWYWGMAERLAKKPGACARAFRLTQPALPEETERPDEEHWEDGSLFVATYGWESTRVSCSTDRSAGTCGSSTEASAHSCRSG